MRSAAVIVLFLATCIHTLPVDFYGLEMTERGQISKFRNWHAYVLYNDDLMQIAHDEAVRMASMEKLDLPSFNFGNRHFVGHCKRITGFTVDLGNSNFRWVGEKRCFNNLNGRLNYTKTDADASQECDDLGIIYEQFYAVGFGIASDPFGVGYVVRLFLTNQSHFERSNITLIV
jgi:hypothetical protein